MKQPKKAMSDGEVNDFAFQKLMGDLDHIEADGMFNESDEKAPSAMGVSVEIKPIMAGEQTKASDPMAEVDDEDEEDGPGE